MINTDHLPFNDQCSHHIETSQLICSALVFKRLTGTAMETAMAPDYTDFFMDNFEQNFWRYYFQETRLALLLISFCGSIAKTSKQCQIFLCPCDEKARHTLINIKTSFCICYCVFLCQKTLISNILSSNLGQAIIVKG